VALRRASERLQQVGATVLGLVLNEVTKQHGYGYGYLYGYQGYATKAPNGHEQHANGKAKVSDGASR